MRSFFRSTRFKVIMGVVGALLIIMIIARALNGWASPQSSIIGAIVTPVQRFSALVSEKFHGLFSVYSEVDELKAQNDKLEEQIRGLTSQVLDYQKIKEENDFYKDYLELKDENPDFLLKDARVISYDTTDQYRAFTIDKGSLAGIAPRDPVITADGLVGYIWESAPTYSTVITILSPNLNAAAIDRRTRDAGSLAGNITLAEQGLTRLSYLSRQSSVAVGDYIVTSGVGGVFPEGLLIGTIKEIKQETQNISRYATIEPAAKLDKLKGVMVITSFDGQSSLNEGGVTSK